jgi:hypothetical protein
MDQRTEILNTSPRTRRAIPRVIVTAMPPRSPEQVAYTHLQRVIKPRRTGIDGLHAIPNGSDRGGS